MFAKKMDACARFSGWAQDGLTALEQETPGYLGRIESRHGADVHGQVLALPWLSDGIANGDSRLLCLLAETPDAGRATAIALTVQPSTALPACS